MADTRIASWDACIDLTAANTDVGRRRPPQLVSDVAAAVQALPGAGIVDVQVHDLAPASLCWLTLHEVGSSMRPEGPAWDDLRAQVEQAVRGVTGVQ